jgi:acetoacetyl-CoA synthetase
MSTPLWSPSQQVIERANLTQFMRYVREHHNAAIYDYGTLYRWSIEYPEQFWTATLRHCGARLHREWQNVLEDGRSMPGARWFVGAELNFAENLLRDIDDSPAIIFVNERGTRRELSRRDVAREVARVADGLRQLGVGPGERVAGFLPNLPETVVAMLATTSLGATWSSCSPDFGVNGVLDRFGQIAPKILITADGYFYGGKTIDSLGTVHGVLDQVSSIEHVIVVPYVETTPSTDGLRNAHRWDDLGSASAPLEFTPVAFDHPLYIMYSSGTTGVPKCIVHGVGGTLLQHLKEHQLHTDVKPGDRVFFFTTCGWMMWNWLVSALASRATVMLYEGSPLHPDPRVLWRFAADERIDIFGTSPRFLAACEKEGVEPGREFELDALRTVLSTGSPLAPENFRYVYRAVKEDLQLASISGGTDIISCFALGNPLLPVHEGELQCRGLGMKVEIYDDAGRPVENEKGELVCSAPFPSMPVAFWNDPDGSRYHAAYFERFANVWCHGDYALLTPRGGLVIYGRSDAVLNPGGVRIGTAEIYRQVEKLPEILESVAVGQEWQNDVRVVLFVKLREGIELDDDLRKTIRDTIRANTTPRHVPARIVAVGDIPRTLSGKIVELAVRETIHGRPVRNTDALANPQALDHFRDRPELTS